ncbi:hypothetical protein DTO013E5_8786 [Penicillium roqueforti]|uniref:uncharacterized protein n=1 Tax=Penicillium roqueforti TaxID=5082 RepID=UPI00190B6E18|nr:uncharacterized protein LCP9604111_8430 [Penicillium roqueforti]KAF9241487.1 hypothetical protein LCP9604111_8430 [Penicillium roqueforti]KAI1830331.1 hypothetical protein CBS147337_8798 [Penicillium roqueforti]KAI2670857.1 hypothetical protein CBS147355_8969 [Penicillium roqueforti]KAI2674662.1 hypothetical protein LCP963914a_8812 [Penicillium roqueforti]KAI2696341.1 hypothetical protein CBS147372_8599 [Penicillium roqueforti]
MTDSSQAQAVDKNVEEVGSRYFLPRNLEEAERMQNQHEWLKGGANGLILAPIDLNRSGLRVLDAATADGYWMQDVKSIFPKDAEFVGFDNAPEGYPPLKDSSQFQIVKQNLVEEFPAEWKDSFDLVHQRFVIPLFKTEEVPLVLRNLIRCVKPGGWIQLVEMDFQTPVSKPIESCPAVQAVHKLTSTVVSDPLASTKLAGRLNDEGLVNVGYKAIEMVAGSSNSDPELGARGKRNMLSVLGFFQSVAKPEMIGMTEEEWKTLPERFAKEMDEHHVALNVYFVWGQKPEAR